VGVSCEKREVLITDYPCKGGKPGQRERHGGFHTNSNIEALVKQRKTHGGAERKPLEHQKKKAASKARRKKKKKNQKKGRSYGKKGRG